MWSTSHVCILIEWINYDSCRGRAQEETRARTKKQRNGEVEKGRRKKKEKTVGGRSV